MSREPSNNPVGRPLKFKSVEELEQKIEEYFASCYDYKRDMFGGRIVDKDDPSHTKATPVYIMVKVKPFTVTALALALDTTRETLMDYEDKAEYSYTIKKAKLAIYADTEEALYTKGATGAIFSLKNNYGWRDKTETDMRLELPQPILGGVSALRSDDGSPEAS